MQCFKTSIFIATATLILAVSAFAQSVHPVTLHTIPAQISQQSSHDYFVSLLQLALDKTGDEYGAATIQFTKPYNQAGALLELMREQHKIDVLWSGSSQTREKNLLAVKIPLLKGLLGYRMPIIHQQNSGFFNQINSAQQLQQLTACQGMYWPDSHILESNQLPVMRLSNNEQSFDHLSKGQCDYFPLAVFEGQAEVDNRQQRFDNLMFYRSLIIYYPLPMYFFTNKNDPLLHQRIELGLQQAISDGSFDQLMQQHPATSFVFPLSNWINNRTIILENPSLNLSPATMNPQLWILPPSLQRPQKINE